MERETGIEPATNSLEGCDSTTELLPPTRLALFASSPLRRASPPPFSLYLSDFNAPCGATRSVACRQTTEEGRPLPTTCSGPAPTFKCAGRMKVGGEGRVRTSVARRRQVYSLLRLTALPPPRNTSLVLVQGTTCLGLSVCIL